MFNISANNIITIARGDSASFDFRVNFGSKFHPDFANWTDITTESGAIIRLADSRLKNAKLYLGVCEPHQPFEEALICQTYTKEDANSDGDVVIKFNTKDTEYLMPGTYYYEIKLLLDNEDAESGTESGSCKHINTLRKRTKFLIID